MYDDDDPIVLAVDDELDSPLDRLEPADSESEPLPDPEAMLLLLASPEAAQRMQAARAFCEVADERAVVPLIALLDDVCPLVRVSVAYALGHNPSPHAVEPLIAQLASDWNGYVRKGLVWALGNCRDRRSLQPLLQALSTDVAAVRLWAASALVQLIQLSYEDLVMAVPPTIEALRRDEVAAVRSNCAWTLGQLCRELPGNVIYATAVDALLEAMVEDEDLGVQEDAKAALLRLGDPRGLQTIEELELEGLC
ncbi:HEAT repeat domain-containing protein [Rubidibacter lacunae]|nr:HEAT repeat domain-containing protein [Rubidibacter lacunae]